MNDNFIKLVGKKVQVSRKCYNKISTLLEELCNTYLEFHDNPEQYIKRRSINGLPSKIISAPPDLIREMSEKYKEAQPCIFQLHCSTKSNALIEQISEILMRSNNLYCTLLEFKPIFEASTYEYVNLRLEQILQSDDLDSQPFELCEEEFLPVLEKRTEDFKKGFYKSVFEFPVVAFQLTSEVHLSSNISIVKINPEALRQVDSNFMERFNATRFYDVNFYLRINIPKKTSAQYSQDLSKRVEGAMIGCINLVTSYQNSRTVSFISADERANHLTCFYRYGVADGDLEFAHSYNFPIQMPKNDSLWRDLIAANKTSGSLANRILSVPESIIELSDRKNILLERVERSLKWFRDAVNETDAQVRIQKTVTSIESLVNFSDEDTTQSFIRRIVKLHCSENENVDNIERQANELYKARSNIIHGSSLTEMLSFNLINFASQCLALGIICYSIYGLDRPKNSKPLKVWLDSKVVQGHRPEET